jgi:mitochondrial fission protein ELM1
VLASPHEGDNTQLLALAGALGWPYEVKRFTYRPYQVVSRLVLGATLAGLDRERSSPIVPPYPDLIIGAGRPTEAIAFWIRKYGNPAVRLVYLGTPWAGPGRFDLVITTPQYRLPKRNNILHNALPLHDISPETLAAEAARFSPRLAHLPRPWIAVLIGGRSGPYDFNGAAASRLGRQASALAGASGGALLVTTSARTSTAASDALEAAITVPSFFFRWDSATGDNPFRAYLALAERIIVTGDSISMLAEACATGKPVMLFDTEEGSRSMRAETYSLAAGQELPPPHWRGSDLDSTAFRLAIRYGPPWWTRDIRIVHRQLVEAGMAGWLGDPPPEPRSAPQNRDMASAVSRIRALLGLA